MTYALGNVAFGISCSQYGLLGTGLTGPTGFLMIFLYRLVEACQNKRRLGTWIDKANSNYWCVDATENDEDVAAEMIQTIVTLDRDTENHDDEIAAALANNKDL